MASTPPYDAGTGVTRSALRIIGSLWLAAVILVLLVAALGAATVYESLHGPERARAMFYGTWWFTLLLALLAANLFATLAVRYPFTRGQTGFVLTHVGVLVILGGALLTRYYGLDGRMALTEGQTVRYIAAAGQTINLLDGTTGARASLDLVDADFDRSADADRNPVAPLTLGDVRVEVVDLLPDSVEVQTVTDDAPHRHAAVELSLGPADHDESVWVFAGDRVGLGPTSVAYRVVDDGGELERLVAAESPSGDRDRGSLHIKLGESVFDVPVSDCTDEPIALGDSGFTVAALRYLPHATVTAGRKVVNASPQPLNPAIEIEVSGRDLVERRLVFARFPDLEFITGPDRIEGLAVGFDAPQSLAPTAPIEVFGRPDGGLYVRFTWEGTSPVTHRLLPGTPLDTPWPGRKLTLLRRFDHARRSRAIVAADSTAGTPVPAVSLRVTAPDHTTTYRLRRGHTRTISIGDATYTLTFGDALVSLDFSVTLDRFRVGYYPGTRRPRTFESRVSILDPARGVRASHVISMNHPMEYGGYTFYQSSYGSEGGRAISYLSVSRDPGQTVVFVGYVMVLAGMLVVLVTRTRARGDTVPLPKNGALIACEDPTSRLALPIVGWRPCESGHGPDHHEPARAVTAREASLGKTR